MQLGITKDVFMGELLGGYREYLEKFNRNVLGVHRNSVYRWLSARLRWSYCSLALSHRYDRFVSRCVLTTVDPETGRRDKESQPLATLKTYVVGWGWGIFVSLRPSVRPASRVRSVALTILVGSISYLYFLSSNFRRCVVCKVYCKISKLEFLAIS